MLDGLGMAETTPGPLIMVTRFVGFLAAYRDAGGLMPLVAATLGAILTTWVTFLPCFLWIFAGAPFIERLRGNAALSAALTAITAVVVGLILNLATGSRSTLYFGKIAPVAILWNSFDTPVLSSINWPAAMLSAVVALAIFRFRLGVLTVLASSAAIGAAWTLLA